jgi:DNA-directed RNA polymerase beta' subunit
MEMNMHVPQSLKAAAELEHLAAVPHHIISPSTNSPIIASNQDNVIGVFKITDDETKFTQIEALQLLSGTESFDGVLPEPAIRDEKRVLWTGKQIYSLILPKITLFLGDIVIRDGELIKGQINKGSSKKIIHTIHNEYGNIIAERYMNDLQCLSTRLLVKTGFSVGVSDLVLHEDIGKMKGEVIDEYKRKENDLYKKIHLNILENITGNLNDTFVNRVNEISGSVDNTVLKNTLDRIDLNNRINYMVTSGAKGSKTNIKQMMCLLGQQTLEGGRVPLGFTGRTLPHYPKYENNMESRGFVTSSYLSGLNPLEFFFHAMSGRIGLIDTAVKTAESGYLQRKLIKAMEDLSAGHDGTVRDVNGNIVQFVYGADGFDPTKLERVKSNWELISSEDLKEKYLILPDDKMTFMTKATITSMTKKHKDYKAKLTAMNKKIQNALDLFHTHMTKFHGRTDKIDLYYPVNFKNLVDKVSRIFALDNFAKTKSKLNPVEIFEELENLLDYMKFTDERNYIAEMLVYDHLAPKRIMNEYHFHREAFDYLLNECRMMFDKARVNAGEMVGVVAGQSIGEISTQLTLNSVTYDTEIELIDNIRLQYNRRTVKIGEWIDKLLSENTNYIEHIPKNRTQYLELSQEQRCSIDSCNMEGLLKVCQITAVTKHLPVGNLVKITLNNDESITVTATQQKSFLVYNKDKQILEVAEGINLKIGDLIPYDDKHYCSKYKSHCEYLPITNIEYITPEENEYVYDLTIPETVNFTVKTGIIMRDTFHLAGVASKGNITLGVPRLKELLTLQKKLKNPQNVIYLENVYATNVDKATVVMNNIAETKINDIIVNDPVFYLNPDKGGNNVLEEDKTFMKFYEVFNDVMETDKSVINNNPWVIRLEFDRKIMLNKNISMSDINLVLMNKFPDATTMYSDDNSGKLVFRLNLSFDSNLSIEDDYNNLRDMSESIKETIIKGVSGISAAFINDDENNKYGNMVVKGRDIGGNTSIGEVYEAQQEVFITTEGTNLVDILMMDNVDTSRCYSIDPLEMYAIFGIEAGNHIIQQQFKSIMTDDKTNIHHIGLLVDKMCHKGYFMSIDRFGINKEDIGPLAKASFEETALILKNAAVFGEVDNLKGVSSTIIVGQIAKCGSGIVRLFLDEEFMIKRLNEIGFNASDELAEEEYLDEVVEVCVDDGEQIRMAHVRSDGVSLETMPQVEIDF